VDIFDSGNNTVFGNTIAFNGGDGVTIGGISGSTDDDGNFIEVNSISSNADLGIDLSNDGPTPNDLEPVW
jgi:hypothetical protein